MTSLSGSFIEFLTLQIVWDEATKKWVNKDGEADEAESFKPPPKMGNTMAMNSQPLQAPQLVAQLPQMNQYPQTQTIPNHQNPGNHMENMNPGFPQQNPMPAMGIENPPVASAPNMFKMQKGRSEL